MGAVDGSDDLGIHRQVNDKGISNSITRFELLNAAQQQGPAAISKRLNQRQIFDVPNCGRHHTVTAGKGLQREDGSNLKTSYRSTVTNRQADASVPSNSGGKLWGRQIWAWVNCSSTEE
ncbi:hypothetical protein Ancab_027379 [Ancistrocladus abbreviatus]